MAEHTPPKWTAKFEEFDSGGKTIPVVDALGMWICGVVTGMRDRKQVKANAQLIAAAPALLAACEGMLRHIDDVLDDQDLMQRRDALVAVIAAAKGKQ